MHIASRIDVDEKAHARHDQQHDAGKRVEPQAKVDAQLAGDDPVPEGDIIGLGRGVDQRQKADKREKKGHANGAAAHPGNQFVAALLDAEQAQTADEEEAQQGQQQHQWC